MVKKFLKERLGTIILFVIVIVFLIWGYFSIEEARSNAITYNEDYEAPEGDVDFTIPGEYVSVAKTDSLELFYNEAKGAIQVKDLESGYLWKGICDDEVYDLGTGSVNGLWRAYLQSSITITYNNLKKRDSGSKKEYVGRECGSIETEYITNGVSVTYGFLTPGIYVTVEYVLEDDQFVVRVPVDKIREETVFAVSTIELLPYFGASRSDAVKDGYLFYPDGSGAITTYAKADTRPSDVTAATYYTYTNKNVNFTNLWQYDQYNRYTAAMPVFGIKNGDNAFLAAFTENGENAGVTVYPSGYVVDLNHAGFEIYVRNTYNVNMYSMSTSIDASVTGGTVERVDKTLIPENREVRYFFLNGDEANYSGMANVYREYLLENNMLSNSISDGAGMPLALNLLMGTTKEGMIFDEYIPMTDFEEAQEIMERLKERGISDMEVVLKAWMKDYDNYEDWGPAKQLGGTGGLKDLNEYLSSSNNIHTYLENCIMFATSETSGVDEKKDVAYDGLNLEISASDFDGTIYYIMNPLAAYNRNNNFLDKLEKYDILGVAYDDVGQYAYADHNEQAPYLKSETVVRLRELLGASEGTGRNVAVLGANQYVYSYADYLYGLREDNYGLVITDYEVPFIQMVVSGLIPYSTEGAGNLAYDLQVQKLKWIEHGSLPFFYLTYESALNLRDTGYDALFSSTYADWEDIVVDTYKEFQENFSCVYGEQIVSHKILTDDVKCVKYGNGVSVYVNYGDEETTADGVTIPAKDYVVVRGGEQ